jgi:hypothetical protein
VLGTALALDVLHLPVGYWTPGKNALLSFVACDKKQTKTFFAP